MQDVPAWLPLLVSGLSLVVSAFIAGWTVYKDVVRKPRFRVSIGVKNIYQGSTTIGPDIWIEALNLGPSPNRIGVPFGRPSWIKRTFLRRMGFFIGYDHSHAGASAKGQRVEVGDMAAFVLPLSSDFVDADFAQIGVSDGFGNLHWCKKSNVRAAKTAIREARRKAAEQGLRAE
ncbi:hypothetical protein GIY56_06065 [Paracoccus sp. YIM 132242]|uniref:Uncharacterized protein n=1 Tax=Paracoccus lichenicola TaxID=2665644 RepID=A0A6L6HP55_9RHOB|nr:hypothetical protein [Paracoccus lichenicola]MTD99844.1 hypothetical protein [Paracoccus lichenicola]